MKPARISYLFTAAALCAAMLVLSFAVVPPARAGVAKDFWNNAAEGDGTQTAATAQPTDQPPAQATAPAQKGAVGKFWDEAASGGKGAATPAPPQPDPGATQAAAAPTEPKGPAEPPEPSQPISDWQRSQFLGIVDILFPPDANKYAEHKTDMYWNVSQSHQLKLMFAAEMVLDPMDKIKTMKDAQETKAVLNGPVGKNWLTCRQYDGQMNLWGNMQPGRLVVVTDPLPNGMYLVFYVTGKDFEARKNDIAVFFESLRVNMPQGEAMWEQHQWRGLSFKSPWGWRQYKGSQWAYDFKGYERGTRREMTFGLGWSKTPYEQELPTVEKLNNVTRLGDKTINGIPVKLYQLASDPGKPFAATLIASVQAPLTTGGYINISGSVVGGEGWGEARQAIDEMFDSLTAEPGILDLSKAAAAVPAQLPEVNATPETAAPETQGNLPMAATPDAADKAPEQAAPAVSLADWQSSNFVGIVDMMTPPDAKKESEARGAKAPAKSMRWAVGGTYDEKLAFGAEMVVNPQTVIKDQYVTIVQKTETELSGSAGKVRFHDIEGNISGKPEKPARILVAADPLPNGMYLVFYALGKDFNARQNEIKAFFDNIRVNLPQGEALWQAHQWKGFNFKTPWGWYSIPIQPAAVSFGGFEPGTGRKMDMTIITDNVPYEATLETSQRIFDIVSLGDRTINGMPVKLYELTRKPGNPFMAELRASVQSPLSAGGYAQIRVAVYGDDSWGQARQRCEEILNSLTADPGVIDMSKAVAAAPAAAPTGNPAPVTAPPETQGNLPMTATPEPTAVATEPAPAATQAAGAVETSCKLKSLRSFYDMTGRSEELHGDGSPEALLELKIKAPGRTIESVTIKSTDGQTAQWDTIPGNGQWLAVITEKGKAINAADGSVSIKLGDGARKFGLLVQDNNALASGKTAFVVKITLDGGEVIDVPVQR